MPSCYSKHQTCGHIQQINLDKAATNSLYLTTLDNMSNSTSTHFPLSVAAMFIQSVVYENPVWDIGLQHQIIKNNTNKLFNMEITKVDRYTTKCICPCGALFKNWHDQIHIDLLPNFKRCEKKIFQNHIDFISHLYHEKNEYYHQIILRLVQSTYSILLAKFRLKTSKETNKCLKPTFSSVHKGKVSLPFYVHSDANYETFTVIR